MTDDTANTQTEDLTPPRIASPRRIVLGIAVVIVLAIGLTLLISRAAGFSEFVGVLRHADVSWLIVSLVAEVACWVGYAALIRLVVMMDGGLRLTAWHTTRLWLVSLGATRIVAPGGAGGIAVVYWALRRAGLRARTAAQRVLGLNMIVFSIFGILAFIAAVVTMVGFSSAVPLGLTLPWLIIVPAVAIVGSWLGAPARGDQLSDPGDGGWLRRVGAAVMSGVVATRVVLLHPRSHAGPIGAALVYWVGDVISLWAAMRSVGADVPLLGVALAYALGYVTLLVPLPTGGFGAIDAATTFALTALDIPLAEAFAGVVVWRALSFWLPTIPALFELARIRDLGRVMGGYTGGDEVPMESAAAE